MTIEEQTQKYVDKMETGVILNKLLKEALKERDRIAREEERERIVERVLLLGNEQIEINNGKLPFVVLNGVANENEKIAIYRQALKDLMAYITPPNN